MSKKAEVISQGIEGILMYCCLSFTCQICKNSSVLPEQTVYIPDKIIGVAVEPVIVIIPALVGAEFFIGTATKNIAAIETFPFHSTKVLINIQKNVFKRLQMTLIDL